MRSLNTKPNSECAAECDSAGEQDTGSAFDYVWNFVTKWRLMQVWLALAVINTFYSGYVSVQQRSDKHDFAHYYATSRSYLDLKNGNGSDAGLTIDGQPIASDLKSLYQLDLNRFYQDAGWDRLQMEINQPTNPPPLIQLFSIYASLPPRTAHLAWMATQLLALALAAFMTYQIVKPYLSLSAYLLILNVFLFMPFILIHLAYSQVQLTLLALVVSAIYFKNQKRDSIACLLIVVAALLKVFPIVLLPWFVWRAGDRWGPRIKTGAISLTALAIGFWLTDINMWQGFVEHARPQITNWVTTSISYTLGTFTHHFSSMVWGEEYSAAYFPLGLAIGLFLLAAFYLYVAFTTSQASPLQELIEVSILILLMLFCGTICWWHYLVFLLLPMSVVGLLLKNTKVTPMKISFCALGILMLMTRDKLSQVDTLPMVLQNFAPLYGMMAMYVFLVMALVKERREPKPSAR